MLKNKYEIGNVNFENLTVYHTLTEFINDCKCYFVSKRLQKTKYIFSGIWENNFNDIFHDFITTYLYIWKIEKNENVTILMYDDYMEIYTKNKSYYYGDFE